MDVVLYLRYSSDRQTEQSIEGQQRVCAEFCKQQGYNIVGRYVDRATSAFKDTEKRTEFNRMIKDSDKQLWQGVIVYKLDRFARNRYDSATYKARLKRNGVKVISATENISDNPEGVILEAVLEGMAEFYSKELSQKITRGMRESAYKCSSVGGMVPLGYKIVNKKYVIDEPSAQIVREAFDLYASGESITEICRIFNSKGYHTARSGTFNKNSFHMMFRNERYVGTFKYDDIRVANGTPAIVDIDTFQKVQNRIALNKRAPARRKSKIDYLLAQKLFCGHCGAPMIGECGTGRLGGIYYYYTCGNRKRNHTCDKTNLRKDYIEKAVAEIAMSLITPERIEMIADAAIKQNQEDIKNNSLIPGLQAEIKDIDKRIKNLLRMVERGVESEDLDARLGELSTLKKDAERRLAAARTDVIELDKVVVVGWLSQFLDGSIEDEEFRGRLIDLLVNSVTVWDEPDGTYKLTIMYNLFEKSPQTRIVTDAGSDLTPNGSPMTYRRTKQRFGRNAALFFCFCDSAETHCYRGEV